MVIKIKGVGFVNKGAELMLHAILGQLKARLPQAKIVMSSTKTETRQKLRALHILPFEYWEKLNMRVEKISNYIPSKICKICGVVTFKDVDAILDASGFAYGDKLGASYSVKMAASIRRLKEKNTKIVLLPQAFGPFSNPAIKKAFASIVENAAAIYARDTESYNHIVNLAGMRENIKKAPDFTNLVEGINDTKYSDKKNRVCIIPNYQMLKKTHPDAGEKYIKLLRKIIIRLIAKGETPFVLIHGGSKDVFLSSKILEGIKDVEIINESSSLVAKGIIGCCKAVISSRYHGIVSGLSQGVLTFGTEWSHKYRALFEDYNFPEGLLPLDLNGSEIENLIEFACGGTGKEQLKEKIIAASEVQKKLVLKMWEEIIKIIS